MIDRYTNKKTSEIWSEQNKFKSWLKVEIAVVKAWNQFGKISDKDTKLIEQNAKFNIDRIYQIEQETHHDVIAFTRAVSESLGPEKKWIHYGLTSTDVVDTGQAIRLKQINLIIEDDLSQILQTLARYSRKYKNIISVGRTHGIHAEPTSIGLKFLRWYSEMERNQERFESIRKRIEVGKISGAVGTFANVPMEIEEYVCSELGLSFQEISTQILPRDLHAEYLSVLSLICSTIEEIATEIRHLSRTEVGEFREGFAKGQKGSSAMPHKRNPIGSENVSGLARVVRGQMITAFEDINLWHERDISHSSAERVILPDSTEITDYILTRMDHILNNLVIDEDRIRQNLEMTHGLVFSQQVLLSLIDAGWSREEAYDTVQPITMEIWQSGNDFVDALLENKEIVKSLGLRKIQSLFDYKRQLRNVDKIFARVLGNDYE
ncbi:adenylosuccinate lyase [Pediococcus claussenii]|uniref:Adenylosuccinate lyase n=1 Tax=Pediococcus claussenii (strain ATCC BAA-344 / DSM 14800 / JCM 18046 / KCTC 3811 / LMG 21948 / P06) TaxID=701521 RepID=G8PCT1_PEDCP|nr:adenylosuccinate lyase [Pediococcus claussenii]AEV95066.1 adenylosuccinate lyase [Pediococcus claussenii ATCC BAA-344]ANZ70254.1 adenylosuccinate lyase [Pediococcus claussenii]ANZ72070.1 adenylosuccinate lyase [Pediococcus claussenii]KRN18927.1 purB protein [Pediococcus claussenii]